MCADVVNFPVLEELNFNQNEYNEYNNDFDRDLREACKDVIVPSPEPGKPGRNVTIAARDIAVVIPPMCKTGDNTNYSYYDMSDERDVAQCQYTWNWEYKMNPKYTVYGPYPDDNTMECE